MSNDSKYNNGKIYTVRYRDDDTLIYVGSTIQPLYKRWNDHKTRSQCATCKEYNKLLYIKMREFGLDNFYIELYENVECNNVEELKKREGEIIRQIGTLNKSVAGRTQKEWKNENEDKIKEYININREKIRQQKMEYDKIHYIQIKDKKKEYKQQHKEHYQELSSQQVTCECGCVLTKYKLSRHQKSKKHIDLMSNITPEPLNT